jgi:urease accessory protein
MRARARIVACSGAAGATVLRELRGEAPLLPRATGPRGGPLAEVHLVGGAAGPLGGDELHLDVEVGPGASLVLRTVAATVALPGPHGDPSSTTIRVRVAGGGRLAVLPEPVVAAAGCDHCLMSTVELDAGAALVWREELVAGRSGETPGRLRQNTRLRYAGTTVLVQELTLDAWSSPAVVGESRTAGSLIVVTDSEPPTAPVVVDGAARMPLGGPVFLCSAVAPEVPRLRHRLASVAPPGWLDG